MKPVVEGQASGSLKDKLNNGPRESRVIADTQKANNQSVTTEQSENTKNNANTKEAVNRVEARQQELEQREIQRLAARDREVRNHERAHATVGGQYAGAPRYQYEKGPDGVNYATSGEVPISASSVGGDPQATIDKAQTIRRAALAPAEPSPQDRRVAAMATQMEAKAQAELLQLQREEQQANQERNTERDASINDAGEVNESRQTNNENNTENYSSPDENTDGTKRFSDVSEQQRDINRLSVELSKKIVDSGIASQAPKPGQVVSDFA